MHPFVYHSTIYNSQDMEATSMSISRWMDKEDVVHTYNVVLVSLKEKSNPTICNNMDGARGYYAQWNKPCGERQVPNAFTHMSSIRTKKPWITEPKNALTVTKGKGVGRMGGKREIRGKVGITISTHNVGGCGCRHSEGSIAQRRQVVSRASYYADRQWL